MPSNLYTQAHSSLSKAEKVSLAAFGFWLGGFTGPVSKMTVDGGRLLSNIQNESHLVGDRSFGDYDELVKFLKRCAKGHAGASTPVQRRAKCGEAFERHQLSGLRIPGDHLPAILYRYSTSRTLFLAVVERVLGSAARQNVNDGMITYEEAFTRVAASWEAGKLTDNERLSGSEVVFATFDHPGGAPRNDAAGMAQALALPILARITGDETILFECTYEAESVANYRFPTVADAEWCHFFRPADEAVPDPSDPSSCHGWTGPLGGQPSQPEIVHGNETLRILTGPPRLVGRIPP